MENSAYEQIQARKAKHGRIITPGTKYVTEFQLAAYRTCRSRK
jgi:hypothetical protein